MLKEMIAAASVCCVAASAALAQAPSKPAEAGVVFVAHDAFAKALAAPGKGVGLVTLAAVRSGNDRVNIDELKRIDATAEGPVSHTNVTEIYYILDGGGVMETGGKIDDAKPMVDKAGKPVNPANIGPSLRGTKMSGGTQHHVGVGDVVVIPPGMPHRFLSLDGSVTYIAVRFNPGFEAGK